MKRSKKSVAAISFFLFGVLLASGFFVWQAQRNQNIPLSQSKWQGRIGETLESSTPDWSRFSFSKSADQAPNILIISLEDIGFGDLGQFGGMFETPNIDMIAREGLRFTNFHIPELKAPVQASLLTGRNHHRIGFSAYGGLPTGFPNTSGIIPQSATPLAKVLQSNGYSTAMFGQWDLAAYYARNPLGPFDTWPLGMGFDRFFGYFERPNQEQTIGVYRDNHLEKIHLNSGEDTTNTQAIAQLLNYLGQHQQVGSGRPFFGYLSLHSPYTQYAKPLAYFDKFWDVFNEGPIQDAENILLKQKVLKIFPQQTVLPRLQIDEQILSQLGTFHFPSYAQEREEAAAKFLLVDQLIGEVYQALEKMGLKENTIIAIFSHSTFPHDSYSKQTSNTPFIGQYSSASPLILSWPAGIVDRGSLRHQYHHVIDLAPTLIELAGVKWPMKVNGINQSSVDGVSMSYSFNRPEAESRRAEQYYEALGKRAMYSKGWLALSAKDNQEWGLYYLKDDPTASKDLATIYPERLRDLKNRWQEEAQQNEVFPIDTRSKQSRMAVDRPLAYQGRDNYRFYPVKSALPSHVLPKLEDSEYIFQIEFTLEERNLGGVLLSHGDLHSGWGLVIDRGELSFFHNSHNKTQMTKPTKISDNKRHLIRLHHRVETSVPASQMTADIHLYLDQKQIGQIRAIPVRASSQNLTKYLSIGRQMGPTLPESYQELGGFEGIIHNVELQMLGQRSQRDFSE